MRQNQIMESRYLQPSLQVRQAYQLARGMSGRDRASAQLIIQGMTRDNQDRLLAEMVALQVNSLRSQRSRYLPESLPLQPIVVVR